VCKQQFKLTGPNMATYCKVLNCIGNQTYIMNLEEKLNSFDLKLPNVTVSSGNYVSFNVRGSIAYVAIQFQFLMSSICIKCN
jgi:hypothetical protein